MTPFLGPLGGERHWRPKLGAAVAPTKGRGHHADHHVPPAAERDGPAYDVWIASKSPLPQPVTEYHDVVAVGLIFFRQKVPADLRPRAQHREKTVGDAHAAQPLRIARADQV